MAEKSLSWGRYPRARQRLLSLHNRNQPLPHSDTSSLPYGNGRSYGDSCLNDGGTLLQTRHLDRFVGFDPESGVLQCESGVLLAEILELCLTQGWFLPVSPGTKYVTVGGAIANDVHGKNHHFHGSFGHHVLEFELLRSDGIRLHCSPTDNADWFAATLGGLGLTGLVTTATLQLRRVASQWMRSESYRLHCLSDFFHLSAALNRNCEYTVAWIDCVAKGKALGRGIFTCADHAPALVSAACPANRRALAMPFTPPFSLINPISLRLFNQLYFHRQPAKPRQATVHYDSFFYPLDGIRKWNRMYGPKGFVQYQCVVPPAISEDAIAELVGQIAASGTGSFLAVLKQFGSRPSIGMLSFPRAGTTLALDFPVAGQTTFQLLDRLDSIVASAGGAVYPAKDARMSGERFRQYFPKWETFRSFIDPAMSSSFWRRVME